MALSACQKVGSSSLTVNDILDGGGDHRVLRMIQKAIDGVNKKATSKISKVCVCVCVGGGGGGVWIKNLKGKGFFNGGTPRGFLVRLKGAPTGF